jgi:heptosyltransferase-2
MKRLSCFVTPDSAAMHVATAASVPVIGLFGPTDPSRHFVPSPGSVIINKKMDCSPCYSAGCLRNFRCMRKITVDEVLNAVEKIMGNSKDCLPVCRLAS